MPTDDRSEAARPESHPAAAAARPHRPQAGPALTFDFTVEEQKLRQEPAWSQHGRNAETLVKHPDFRIVLMIMQAGNRLKEHEAPGQISIHTLKGRVRLHLGERVVDLPAGRLLALERGVTHDVEAVEESAVLLSIAWPGDAGGR